MVRTCSAALGLTALLRDLGNPTQIQLLTDASAAKGISQRTGLGKVRHLETSQLWLQDLVLAGRITVKKISTDENLADMLTKHVEAKAIDYHMQSTHSTRTSGKHKLGLTIAD